MVQKRPFFEEELYNFCSKHARQVDHGDKLVSFSEFVSAGVATLTPYTSGQHGSVDSGNTAKGDVRPASEAVSRLPASSEKNIETTFQGSRFIPSWSYSSNSEEAYASEPLAYAFSSPEYFSSNRPVRSVANYGDLYSLLLQRPPRKVVPIGVNHQADIPEWAEHGCNEISKSSDESGGVNKDEKRLMGTCVVPMPDLEVTDDVGKGTFGCTCLDEGSVKCVRQHIAEAREKLRRIFGQERFVELGFCDMGEQVASKWSEEEEHLFHEVVFSNPMSVGKNFWNHLSVVFPYRTKQEIVSYYFNVFMLRKRAEQNRLCPMNIDSDNDEWQGSDNETETSEEDEDSVIESPAREEDCAYNLSQKEDLCVYDEGAADDTCDAIESLEFPCGRDISKFSETCFSKSLDKSYLDTNPWDATDDQEIQDDSCSSSDTGVSSKGTQEHAETDNHWHGAFAGLSSGSGQEFGIEPCDAKIWDAGYTTCPKSDFDFLPTCSMIEEVFGDGSCNHKARDKSFG